MHEYRKDFNTTYKNSQHYKAFFRILTKGSLINFLFIITIYTMSQEFIHLHTNKLNRNHNVFFLFIPAIIFAILIAFLFSKLHGGEVAGIQISLP